MITEEVFRASGLEMGFDAVEGVEERDDGGFVGGLAAGEA